MSIKSTLAAIPPKTLIGGVLIILSIWGFRDNARILPALGATVGTWLLILSWNQVKESTTIMQLRTDVRHLLLRLMTRVRDRLLS